jgi:sporadic carbohydrate cluster 2OG-Fe(II) oxygenase
MNFLTNNEQKLSKEFLKKGYMISKVSNKQSLNFISKLIKDNVCKLLKLKKIDLNYIHNYVKVEDLNVFRVKIITEINKNKYLRLHYFNICKELIYLFSGNELMMQKNINLSIQFPNDNSSLLPIHSDVWSGDSPYEINVWLPLVDCYKTKSMYILEQKNINFFEKKIKSIKTKSSDEIYKIIKKKLKWLKVNYGEFLIFNQGLPHGNIVNTEKETRWTMNCRFKNIHSPYGDKKIGEFFLPITSRAMTEIGINFRYPF